jgi:predicted transcriptional regulator
MLKETILENQRRKEIYDFLISNPGFHMRELQRRLDFPLTSLEYHLDYMVRKNVLRRERDGRFTRFYARLLDEKDEEVLSILRQRKLREIIMLIIAKDGITFRDMQDITKLPTSTLSYYIKQLADQGLISKERIGHEILYKTDDARIEKVLVAYRSSFLDRLIDRVLFTFVETQFQKKQKQ